MSATMKDKIKYFCQQQELAEEEVMQKLSEEIGKIKTPEESLGITSAEWEKIVDKLDEELLK